MNKKEIARSGKRMAERSLFWLRRTFVERRLDPAENSTLLSWATYSPWLKDEAFRSAHAAIRDNTLVDLYRCWELWHLLGQTRDLPGDVLEVGAWRGGTGCLLGRRAALLGLGCAVHLCDTFTGVVKSGEADACYSDGEHAETSVPVVESLARSMGLENLAVHVGVFPEDTGAALADRGFRFCHIDVDVYRSGKDVLEWVWPRLATGGVVVFDDFGFASTTGIRKLVHEVEDLPGRVCLQNLNGHAVLVKTG